jgi:molybdopterin synthase catalytic subunit
VATEVTADLGPVRLVGITSEPLSVDRITTAVADRRSGASVVFVGAVRDHDDGRDVTLLTYEAHPSAGNKIAQIATEIAALPHVLAVAAQHRTGELAVGDLAVVVAVSTARRGDAFEVARLLIERIKGEVPIWKLQQFADGGSEWVACHTEPGPGPAPSAAAAGIDIQPAAGG